MVHMPFRSRFVISCALVQTEKQQNSYSEERGQVCFQDLNVSEPKHGSKWLKPDIKSALKLN